MAAGCKGCPSHGGPRTIPKLTPEQKKKLLELQKKQLEVQKEYQKVTVPIVEEYKQLLKSIKKCKHCKKTKLRVLICDHHFERMEALNKAMGKIQLTFKLKQELERA